MSRIPTCTLFLLIAVLPTAQAAPTTAATDGAAQEIDAAGVAGGRLSGLSDNMGTADDRDTSKTIRMLLELQGAPPPLEGQTDTRRRQRLVAAKRLRAESPGSGPTPSSSLSSNLGTNGVGAQEPAPAPGAAPAAAPDGTAIVVAGKVDWRAGLPGRTADVGITPASMHEAGYGPGGGRPARPGSNTGDMDAVKALLPARLLALLREYREWLLAGGLVVLTVLGLSASAMSQRRR
jgi:hypothetical protein